MRKLLFSMITVCTSVSLLFGQYETGVGTRAAAMANNHTALISGVPDLYWNPGALGFSVTREFQASLYGHRLSSESTFFGKSTDTYSQHPGFGNAGFSYAIPASRGGMSFAAAYSNPISLDDAFKFSGSYLIGETRVDVRERTFRSVGDLHFWTFGFGLQVAPNLGAGISGSLVSGKSKIVDINNVSENGEDPYISDVWNEHNKDTYLGYDVRIGLMYRTEALQTGCRLVFPRKMRLTDNIDGTSYNYEDDYRMYSSYSGAWGVSTRLPWCTVTAELRSVLPYNLIFPLEEIPRSNQGNYFKTGGGAGVEVPIPGISAVARLGYSYDELDLNPWVYTVLDDINTIEWDMTETKVNRNLHKISTGIGFTSATTSFDIAYSFSTWGITSRKVLEQTYYLHRFLTSFTIRF